MTHKSCPKRVFDAHLTHICALTGTLTVMNILILNEIPVQNIDLELDKIDPVPN